MIEGHQLAPGLVAVAARLPVGIEDRVMRTQRLGRIAVAIDAPVHGQRRALPGQFHLTDRAVTGRAADAFGDVDRMVEVNVIGQLVDALPVDRLVLGKARANRRQHSGIGP